MVTLLQRAELVARISDEIERYLVELGTDGRLVRLQLRELMAGVEDERRLVVLDYFQSDASWDLEQAIDTLSDLDMDHLLDAEEVAHALHLSGQTDELDSPIQPRGYRMLARIPRMPEDLAEQADRALRVAREAQPGLGGGPDGDRRCERALGRHGQGGAGPHRGVQHPRPLHLSGPWASTPPSTRAAAWWWPAPWRTGGTGSWPRAPRPTRCG